MLLPREPGGAGAPEAQLISWDGGSTGWDAITRSTGGLDRYTGTARVGDAERPWSLILKVIRRVEGAGNPTDAIWLWLEEVREAIGPDWPIERYGLAARHLGHLGAHFARQPQPDLAPV